MKKHLTPTENYKNDWITPKWILDPLGIFDLDPACSINMPWNTAYIMLNINDDSLNRDWFGRVWLNPPFERGLREKFMLKMSEHNNGIMLVPASCETLGFQKAVYGKAEGILMLNKRPHFHYPNGVKAKANSGQTICLIAYGKENFKILLDSNLGHMLVEYKSPTE